MTTASSITGATWVAIDVAKAAQRHVLRQAGCAAYRLARLTAEEAIVNPGAFVVAKG